MGYDKGIIGVGRGGKEVFEEILKSINPEDIFRKKFKDRIVLFLMTTCDLLDINKVYTTNERNKWKRNSQIKRRSRKYTRRRRKSYIGVKRECG